MKTRSIAVALLLSLTPATFASYAGAQDDPTTRAARSRFQEGVDYYDKGQYENARASFLQAYALRKHPAVLLNLAQSSLRSGHTLEAARYFQQYLREATSATPAARNDAEKGLSDARQKLGRIYVEAPSGADVYVDDDRVGVAPLRDPVDVEPGTHAVRVHGRTDDATSLAVMAGQQVTAKLNGPSSTASAPAPPPPAPAPPANAEPPSPSPEPTSEPTTNTATNADVAAQPLEHSRGKNIVPAVIGASVAGISFGVAIAMGIAKQNAQNSADSVASQIKDHAIKQGRSTNGICTSTAPSDQKTFGAACQTLSDDNDKVNTDATVANVALSVGVAATAFTVIYLIVAKRRDEAPKAPPVQGFVGPGIGGMMLQGSF